MNSKDILNKFKKAVDSEINSWQRADRLTQLEQREKAQTFIYGITVAALYVLPEEDYHELVNYIHENGFNH